MNLKEYISSGILESYLIGELSSEETKQVEAMAAEHPEVKKELQRIELALEQYAVLYGTLPPAGTLANIQSKIPVANLSDSNTNSTPSKGAFIGVVLIAFVASILAGWFYNNWNESTEQIEQRQEELIALQADCELQSERIERQSALIDLLLSPSTQSVQMQGTENAPEAIAQVFFNLNTQEVYLDTGSLPEPASDKSYQLWALIDGQPIDMGVFELNSTSDELKAVPFIEGAQTYAVTLEESGGSPTPNLEQLFVIGNVS